MLSEIERNTSRFGEVRRLGGMPFCETQRFSSDLRPLASYHPDIERIITADKDASKLSIISLFESLKSKRYKKQRKLFREDKNFRGVEHLEKHAIQPSTKGCNQLASFECCKYRRVNFHISRFRQLLIALRKF
jgi:hypothetical protein